MKQRVEFPLESKHQIIYCDNARGHCLVESLLLETNIVLSFKENALQW